MRSVWNYSDWSDVGDSSTNCRRHPGQPAQVIALLLPEYNSRASFLSSMEEYSMKNEQALVRQFDGTDFDTLCETCRLCCAGGEQRGHNFISNWSACSAIKPKDFDFHSIWMLWVLLQNTHFLRYQPCLVGRGRNEAAVD